MRLLGRLFWLCFGLLLAIPAGAAALLAATILDPVAGALLGDLLWTGGAAFADGLPDPEAWTGGPEALSSAAAALLVAPPVLTALVAEVAGFRSLLWHAGMTGAVTALMPWLQRSSARTATPEEAHLTLVLLATGAAAGLTYWLVAGRDAGGRPRPFVPGALTPPRA